MLSSCMVSQGKPLAGIQVSGMAEQSLGQAEAQEARLPNQSGYSVPTGIAFSGSQFLQSELFG